MSNIKKFRIKSFKDKSDILKLNKVSLKFGRKIVLDNLNLQLNNVQILGLLGANGAGKSTIFNLILGLVSPDYGSIIINNETVNKYPIHQRTLQFQIGMCPQIGGFFSDLTVYENLKAIAEITISDESYRAEKINSLISWSVLMVITSKAAKGSSKRRILGSEISASAIEIFFFCPPERKSALMSLIGSNSNLEINELIFSAL